MIPDFLNSFIKSTKLGENLTQISTGTVPHDDFSLILPGPKYSIIFLTDQEDSIDFISFRANNLDYSHPCPKRILANTLKFRLSRCSALVVLEPLLFTLFPLHF